MQDHQQALSESDLSGARKKDALRLVSESVKVTGRIVEYTSSASKHDRHIDLGQSNRGTTMMIP